MEFVAKDIIPHFSQKNCWVLTKKKRKLLLEALLVADSTYNDPGMNEFKKSLYNIPKATMQPIVFKPAPSARKATSMGHQSGDDNGGDTGASYMSADFYSSKVSRDAANIFGKKLYHQDAVITKASGLRPVRDIVKAAASVQQISERVFSEFVIPAAGGDILVKSEDEEGGTRPFKRAKLGPELKVKVKLEDGFSLPVKVEGVKVKEEKPEIKLE